MKYSPEERKEWKEKMTETARKVRALSDAERAELAAKMNIRTCEGHPISQFNQIYLTSQSGRMDLTLIGGFKQWQKAGRQVSPGQKAIGYIFVPLGKGKASEDTAQGDDKMRFRLVPVFDVSQTEEISEVAA